MIKLGFVLLGAALVAALVVGLVAVFDQEDGTPLDPEPASAAPVKWTMAQARAFNEHELYYLGQTYQGLPLMQVLRIDWPGSFPDDPKMNRPDHEVIFVYGDCEISPGEDRCPVPLTVTVRPASEIPHDMVKTGAGPPECVRGALVQQLKNGNIQMWTGDATVGIETNGVNLGQAVSRLMRANGGKPDVPGQPFPPPKGGECN